MTQRFSTINEAGLEELQAELGKEYRVLDAFNEYASVDTIRHFVRSFGDTNPLFNEPEYASETSWGSLIAPPTFLFTTMNGRGGRIGLPGVHALWGGVEFSCHSPIRVGDRISGIVAMSKLIPKESEFSGRSVYQEMTYTFTNQREEVVAHVVQWIIRTERDTARKRAKYSSLSPPQYTRAEIEAIEFDYGKERIRGSMPRRWSEVQVGDDLGLVVKGPLTTTDNVAWKIGWGFYPYTFPHRIGFEFRKRHPGVTVVNEFGCPDFPERVHWDASFAKHVGVPRAFDTGPQRASWLGQLLTNWMGDDGFIRRFRCTAKRVNLVGDTSWCRGSVRRKYVEDDEHRIDCELRCVDQRGEVTMPASATIVLPE